MLKDLSAILKSYEPKPLGQKRSYAVLLPLIYQDEEWQVLYQVRSEAISQPGEVSFPGGAVEMHETFEEAAVRETMEELNISKEAISVLGEIDYLVHTHRTIHCFVGVLQLSDWRAIKPNEEVAKLFTIPLQDLMDQPPHYYQLTAEVQASSDFPFERIRNGTDYRFNHYNRRVPFYDVTEENIWGMTAQLTHRFTEILKETGF